MLLSMTLMFTACDDDRDSNPTLSQPTAGQVLGKAV